ncbi:MAG: ABC transporter ATP-binding protein [Lachnospiraceae bacterium]|nr:ABC transporter ATP-binding protein [Lachnospiraceae bacterium]
MIKVKDLVKNYGSFEAVKGLNMNVEKGQVVGLLGPNGAGKSTTMNIITGYISATSGSVVIDGHDIMTEPMAAKKAIGYLPEIPPLYMDMTVLSYLKFVAELKGVPSKERAEEVKKAMKAVRIADRATRIISKLSKGYKQRVGVAAALIGNPPILILDEPTVGLDPSQVVEIRELIKNLAKEHTVILSSHILSEVSEVCDHIIIINNGTVVAEDTPENLSNAYSNQSHVNMEIKGDEASISAVLDGMDYVSSYTFGEVVDDIIAVKLILDTDEDKNDELFFAFAEAKLPVHKVSRENLSLEQVFLKLTEDEAADHAEKAEDAVEENAENGDSDDESYDSDEEAIITDDEEESEVEE